MADAPDYRPPVPRPPSPVPCFLGIEIGGTKLQLGVGGGDGGKLAALVRRDIDARKGAVAILDEIERSARPLIEQHTIERVGFGFGGPIDSATGVVTKSHQVAGWDHFPLAQWCQEKLGKPAVLGNDCDVAALAEAHSGAGQGAACVFYVTVGTGIGGGLVLNGKLHGAGRPAVAEIGHLRPGLAATGSEQTVESLASGPAIAAAAAALLAQGRFSSEAEEIAATELLRACDGQPWRLTAKLVGEAAANGNTVAREVLEQAVKALGWAIAQVITIVAPEVVVVGGGVSLIGENLFFAPLRKDVARYVFPPLVSSYKIVPAALGELAVVYGAIALAKAS